MDCLVCTELLDVDDQHFRPCACGFRICSFCQHQVTEVAAASSQAARCPACRTEYDSRARERRPPMAAEGSGLEVSGVARRRRRGGLEETGAASASAAQDRSRLAHMRVVQRNLVYVVGLTLSVCREELLKSASHFGRFGKIVKVSVNRSYAGSRESGGSHTGSAYVTFLRAEDALRCIAECDGRSVDGHALRACLGTTKYCNAFLKYQTCGNADCLYLHAVGPEADSFSKEEMLGRYGTSKHAHFQSATLSVGVGQAVAAAAAAAGTQAQSHAVPLPRHTMPVPPMAHPPAPRMAPSVAAHGVAAWQQQQTVGSERGAVSSAASGAHVPSHLSFVQAGPPVRYPGIAGGPPAEVGLPVPPSWSQWGAPPVSVPPPHHLHDPLPLTLPPVIGIGGGGGPAAPRSRYNFAQESLAGHSSGGAAGWGVPPASASAPDFNGAAAAHAARQQARAAYEAAVHLGSLSLSAAQGEQQQQQQQPQQQPQQHAHAHAQPVPAPRTRPLPRPGGAVTEQGKAPRGARRGEGRTPQAVVRTSRRRTRLELGRAEGGAEQGAL